MQVPTPRFYANESRFDNWVTYTGRTVQAAGTEYKNSLYKMCARGRGHGWGGGQLHTGTCGCAGGSSTSQII